MIVCWPHLEKRNLSSSFHLQFSSVQSLSRVWLCDPMDCSTRLPCPSPAPEAYSNPCPSSWWCHPTISSSVVPFSSCLQSFPAWKYFQMSQFFASGGQSIGGSTSALVHQYSGLISFRIDCLDLLAVQGTLKSLLQHHSLLQQHCLPLAYKLLLLFLVLLYISEGP